MQQIVEFIGFFFILFAVAGIFSIVLTGVWSISAKDEAKISEAAKKVDKVRAEAAKKGWPLHMDSYYNGREIYVDNFLPHHTYNSSHDTYEDLQRYKSKNPVSYKQGVLEI